MKRTHIPLRNHPSTSNHPLPGDIPVIKHILISLRIPWLGEILQSLTDLSNHPPPHTHFWLETLVGIYVCFFLPWPLGCV